MTTVTRTEVQTLVAMECHACHILFAMPADLNRRALANHSITFYCPNGHGAVYAGKTAAQKETERLERELTNARDDARAAQMQRDDERRSHAATKGQLTKVRKRADRGMCQHCRRSFANVARHVENMHPEAVTS